MAYDPKELLKTIYAHEDYQPCEDDAFMIQALAMDGYDNHTFINMPALDEPMYYYNYLREGSNMFRHMRGEQI